jgi:hypothetical protein
MSDLSDDLMIGGAVVCEFLFGGTGKTQMRRLYHLTSEVSQQDRLPVFRLGGRKGPICARRSTLTAFIAGLEHRQANQ